MTPHVAPRARLAAVGLWVWTGLAVPAVAQTPDELFDDGTLHQVRLSVHSADWAKLKADFQENTYYPADLEWRGVKVRNVGIRSRGLATRNEFKPGLRVDMNRYVSGQRFLGLRALLLDNNYRDISLLRERVTMTLFARLGFPAPRQSHARLYVNGEYAGVYSVVEELGEDFVRRAFTHAETGEPGRGTLYEYHWLEPWDFGYLGSGFEPYERRFEARTHENDPRPTLYGPIEELVRTVNEAPADRFTESVAPLVDVAQVVRYVALENFLVEHDGLLGYKGMANFYLYRPDDDPRALLVPWDKDQTFYVANRDTGHALGENVLVRRALDNPDLRRLYYETLVEAARVAQEPGHAGLPWLEGEVVRGIDQIRDAVLADPHRWFGVQDFSDELARMREFARTRPAFVQCQAEQVLDPEAPRRECSAPDRTPPP
jgi:spore coat protein CotH